MTSLISDADTWTSSLRVSVQQIRQDVEAAHSAGFLLGFTHTSASYTSMASNIRNQPITPGLLYVLPIGVA